MNEPPFSGSEGGRRRSRRARLGAPRLFPAALVAGAAVLLWAFRGDLARVDLVAAAAGPETQIRAALARQDRAALDDVYGFHAGGTVELQPVRFAEVQVAMDGGRAQVLAIVEAQGTARWRAEQAELRYVGREAFRMDPCSVARWCADGEQFARLRGVLTALLRLSDACAARDVAAATRMISDAYRAPGGKPALVDRLREEYRTAAPERHVRAWQIRVERDRAQAGEDYDLATAAGPERRRAAYALALEGDRWVFVDGL